MRKTIFNQRLVTALMMVLAASLLTGVFSTTSVRAQEDPTESPQIPGTDGVLIGADYWSDEPMILSAGLGFEGIIGVGELSEEAMREAGANWDGSMVCTNGTEPADQARTSAPAQAGVSAITTGQPEFADALPIVFSWPVATETVDDTDFAFTLGTGHMNR
jgi:hypothetical protein